jgi:hypothetical protein
VDSRVKFSCWPVRSWQISLWGGLASSSLPMPHIGSSDRLRSVTFPVVEIGIKFGYVTWPAWSLLHVRILRSVSFLALLFFYGGWRPMERKGTSFCSGKDKRSKASVKKKERARGWNWCVRQIKVWCRLVSGNVKETCQQRKGK